MQTAIHPSGDPLADRRADYAAGLAADGDPTAAADLMRQALALAPGWAGGWHLLGTYLERAGDGDAAAEAFRRVAALDRDDRLGAEAKLAALGKGRTPETLPAAFVRGLFDQYADRFDRHLRNGLSYAAPEHLIAAIRPRRADEPAFDAALDLGCGTGLMGALVRSIAKRLVGLDLSPKMLAKARAKAIYDALYETDILAFACDEDSFDLVCAADVLNYIGDLTPVFTSVSRWLRPGGSFAFTVESHGGEAPYALGDTMRYTHAGNAVAKRLAAVGLRPVGARPAVLREDRGMPVEGIVFLAEKIG